jgi:uncharacterized protein YecE (DUF72 family)
MKEPHKPVGSHREQLLEKLNTFELAFELVHPSYRGPIDWKERAATLREATVGLRLYLSDHLAPKELMEWRELPDSDADIASFAYELKMEHADLLRELGNLIQAIDKLETTLDRHEATLQICKQGHSLAQRIARHAGGEEAELGRYF